MIMRKTGLEVGKIMTTPENDVGEWAQPVIA